MERSQQCFTTPWPSFFSGSHSTVTGSFFIRETNVYPFPIPTSSSARLPSIQKLRNARLLTDVGGYIPSGMYPRRGHAIFARAEAASSQGGGCIPAAEVTSGGVELAASYSWRDAYQRRRLPFPVVTATSLARLHPHVSGSFPTISDGSLLHLLLHPLRKVLSLVQLHPRRKFYPHGGGCILTALTNSMWLRLHPHGDGRWILPRDNGCISRLWLHPRHSGCMPYGSCYTTTRKVHVTVS